MTFSALSSTYQLYKQDTDSVAAWLASTAKSLGFSAAFSSKAPSSKATGSSRLKGKARTQAKMQAATFTTSTKKPEKPAGPKYIINIKDFVPLAEYVAEKATLVPATVGSTIDRVIAARTGFGGQLEKSGKVLSETSNSKHEYFIGVLEKVREVLKPLMPTDEAKPDKPKGDDLSNRFAGLAVYEPSQEFLDAPPIERPVTAQDDNVVYEAETDTTPEYAFFALTAVINDMNRVRSRIQWIWSNYSSGIFDLAAAAIATNTAIDLVRNMMEDIMPLIDNHGGIRLMLMQFHIGQCLEKGWDSDELLVESQDKFNYETYDDGTYFTTYRLIEGFLAVLDPNRLQLPLYKEGMFGSYDPESDRSLKSGQEKFHDDRALLMPFFTELATAIRGGETWPVKDEFLRGMEELERTRRIPFYLVFAAQVFLDITYELGDYIESPFETLVTHSTAMDNDIKAHFEFHTKLKIKHWPASNNTVIKELHKAINWVGKDPLLKIQAKLYGRLGAEMPAKESHRIFRMSPVICGLYLYHFRSRYRAIGLAVANAWGSIQYCEHLHNALFQEGQLHARWQDMDIITTNLGEDSFFVGGEVPKTPQDYLKKFCLQMGTTAAAMAKGRRNNASLESKAGPRGLKDASPVLTKFQARYVESSGQVDFTPEYVSQIIDLSLFEQEGSESDGTLILGQIEDPEKLKEKKKPQLLNHQRRAATSNGNLPIQELPKHLVFALNAETLEYSFPYLHMHRWCWKVLRAVKDNCDSVLREIYTPAYLEDETQLPWVVGWVFMALCGSDKSVPDRRPFEKAAEAMNVFIDTGASSFISREVLGKIFGMPIEFELEQDPLD